MESDEVDVSPEVEINTPLLNNDDDDTSNSQSEPYRRRFHPCADKHGDGSITDFRDLLEELDDNERDAQNEANDSNDENSNTFDRNLFNADVIQQLVNRPDDDDGYINIEENDAEQEEERIEVLVNRFGHQYRVKASDLVSLSDEKGAGQPTPQGMYLRKVPGGFRYGIRDDRAVETDIDNIGTDDCAKSDKGTQCHHNHPGRTDTFLENVEDEIFHCYNEIANVTSQVKFQAEELILKMWHVVEHASLPDWLKDNEFLLTGHRPELRSYWACYKSVFRIHTETGNIWSHLIAFVAFLTIAIYFLSRPSYQINVREKLVFSCFFVGANACFLFSSTFHTMSCHSQDVGKFWNKLDYFGICTMILGSFVPWLYYSFYCHVAEQISYISLISVLTMACMVVSLMDRFRKRKFRSVRAGLFIGLGLSSIIPVCHFVANEGFWNAVDEACLGWLCLMGFLYISGAIIYACRIPERFSPGRFDIWGQSHQIFHVFVVIAAFVHYHGISMLVDHRLSSSECYQIAQ